MLWPLEEAQAIVDEAMRSESRLRRKAMQAYINDGKMPRPSWEKHPFLTDELIAGVKDPIQRKELAATLAEWRIKRKPPTKPENFWELLGELRGKLLETKMSHQKASVLAMEMGMSTKFPEVVRLIVELCEETNPATQKSRQPMRTDPVSKDSTGNVP